MPTDVPTILIGGALFAVLAVMTIADLQRMIIPDWSSAALLLLGVANVAVRGTPSAAGALAGAACGAGVFLAIKVCYRWLRGREGLGWGDVKFMAGAGSLVGLMFLPWLVLIAAVSGILAVLATQSAGRDKRLPFAPHLAMGLMACWLFQAMNGL